MAQDARPLDILNFNAAAAAAIDYVQAIQLHMQLAICQTPPNPPAPEP